MERQQEIRISYIEGIDLGGEGKRKTKAETDEQY